MQWYWMGFSWSYPNGRIPCLIPVTWYEEQLNWFAWSDALLRGSDGFPVPTVRFRSMLEAGRC